MDKAELRSLREFGLRLPSMLAMPALGAGYAELVSELRRNRELARSVRELGADTVLASGDPGLAHMRKANRELVTAAEQEAERFMRRAVEQRYPDHAVVGEEHGYRPGSRVRWVFDPVDGTSAMVRTAMADAYDLARPDPRPSFGITVALVCGSEATLGIVTELRSEEGRLVDVNTWVGTAGERTICNGGVVDPPKQLARLAQARLASTVPEVMFNTPKKWSSFQALSDATAGCVTDQNCVGFMGLLQNDKRIHIVYEADLAYHDAAALVPILQGGGIEVTDDEGADLNFDESLIGCEFRVLAAASRLHRMALYTVHVGVAPEVNRFRCVATAHRGYAQKFENLE